MDIKDWWLILWILIVLFGGIILFHGLAIIPIQLDRWVREERKKYKGGDPWYAPPPPDFSNKNKSNQT